ncbi:MAG: hypothetical protein COV48_04425, partial [Elusimicrobia bacterium CG11_big_fil_rev_8_21_14_0_20_64_6]
SHRGIEAIVLEEVSQRLRPQAVEIAARLAPHFKGGGEEELLPLLQAAQAQTGAEYAVAVDRSRRIISHTNVIEVGKLLDPGDSGGAGGRLVRGRSHSNHDALLTLSVPVWEPSGEFLLSSRDKNSQLGELGFGFPVERSLASASLISRYVAVLIALFCLISLAITLGLLQWLLRPVRQLVDATGRIMAGDYGGTVPVATKDEIGDLAGSFNRMSETLSRTTVSRDELSKTLVITRATIEASPEGILVFDKEDSVLIFNQRMLEMWDLTPEIIARGRPTIMAHVSKSLADPDAFVKRSNEILLHIDKGHIDELILKNGRVYRRTVLPMLVNGAVFARVLNFEDMTLQSEKERALEEAHNEAVQVARMKSEFLANISHELRTPLNAVVGSAEFLRAEPLAPAQREHVEVMAKAAAALLAMVNGVLDFSKIEAGRMTCENIAFSPRGVFRDALAITQPHAAQKGLELLCATLPEEDDVFLGDPGRLSQILLNLIDNAIKFTESGTVRLSGEVVAGDAGFVVLKIAVVDSGIGIDPDILPLVFSPFTQADSSTTRRYGGTGLGLAICRSLVELLGGAIGATSEPGAGSTFWVHIPFMRATAESGEAPRAGAVAQPSGKRLDRQRVLVVEDNETNSRLLRAQISRLGRPLEVASNGAAALEAMARDEYGFILMDCQMPGMDGYEATRRVREAESGRRRVPIIALTAHARASDRARCLAAGMDDYLTKPVSLGDLAAALDQWDIPFDETALKAYADLAAPDGAALRSLLQGFIEDTTRALERVRAAIKKGERADVPNQVHAVKGAAAALGARGLRELCRRIELAEAASEHDEVESLLAQAEDELARIRNDRGEA